MPPPHTVQEFHPSARLPAWLKETPQEQTRRIERYSRGLVLDWLAREQMAVLDEEVAELTHRVQEPQHRLVRLERTQTQQEAVRVLAELMRRDGHDGLETVCTDFGQAMGTVIAPDSD